MTPWTIAINNLHNLTPPPPKRGRHITFTATEKECSQCHELKPLSAFRWMPTRYTYQSACRVCENIRQKSIRKSRGTSK